MQEIELEALGISQTLRSHSRCRGNWLATGFTKMSRKLWYLSGTSSSEVFSLGSSGAVASVGGSSVCSALDMRALSCSFDMLVAAFQATKTSSTGNLLVGSVSSLGPKTCSSSWNWVSVMGLLGRTRVVARATKSTWSGLSCTRVWCRCIRHLWRLGYFAYSMVRIFT